LFVIIYVFIFTVIVVFACVLLNVHTANLVSQKLFNCIQF